MRLDLYTLTYNEQDIVPFILQYWTSILQQGIDLHCYIYDNYSTDNTVQLLSQCPYVEIRHFESGDGHNDIIHQQLKQNCWLESKGRADWCCVCDFDEILWSQDLLSELTYAEENNFNVIGMKWYAFCGDSFPQYTEEKYLHQLVKKGYKQYINHVEQFKHLGKFILFNPNKVDYILWSVGQHILHKLIPYMRLYITNKIVTFHVNKGLGEDYFVEKRKRMNKRLSQTNKKYGMGIEYGLPEEEMRKEYKKYQAESEDISNL